MFLGLTQRLAIDDGVSRWCLNSFRLKERIDDAVHSTSSSGALRLADRRPDRCPRYREPHLGGAVVVRPQTADRCSVMLWSTTKYNLIYHAAKMSYTIDLIIDSLIIVPNVRVMYRGFEQGIPL